MSGEREFPEVRFDGSELTVRDHMDFGDAVGVEFAVALTRLKDVGPGGPQGFVGSVDAMRAMAGVYWVLARHQDPSLTYDDCLGLTPGALMRLMVREEVAEPDGDPPVG